MCIQYAPKTIADLRALANAIEHRYSLTDDVAIKESLNKDFNLTGELSTLLTEVIHSLLGVVNLHEVLINPNGDRPELVGKTLPQIESIDYDAIAHSIYALE